MHLFSGHGKYYIYIESLKKAQLLELALRSFKGHRNYKVALSLIRASRPNRAGDEPHTPSWCVCGHCRNMKRKEEELCCKNTMHLSDDTKWIQADTHAWTTVSSLRTYLATKESFIDRKLTDNSAIGSMETWEVECEHQIHLVLYETSRRDCYPEEDTGGIASYKLLWGAKVKRKEIEIYFSYK